MYQAEVKTSRTVPKDLRVKICGLDAIIWQTVSKDVQARKRNSSRALWPASCKVGVLSHLTERTIAKKQVKLLPLHSQQKQKLV